MTDPKPGDHVGAYQLEELVARGSTSVVFRARHVDSQERVALKLLVGPAVRSQQLRENEYRLLERHPHSGLATVVGHGDHDSVPWVATRWVEGRTLGHLLRTEGPLPIDRAVRILTPVAAALDHLASAGLVHGDLSPSNIVVDVSDRAVVVDLGMSRPAISPNETAEPGVIGTPRYLAPEVAHGRPEVGHSDQYSLAAIAYETMTGSGPFPAVADEPMAVLQQHLNATVIPASERVPGLVGAVESALSRALSKPPEDRFGTAAAFIAAIGEPANSGLDPTSGVDLGPSGQPHSGAAPNRYVLAGAALAFVVVLLVGLALLLRQPSSGTDPLVESSCNIVTIPTFDAGGQLDNYFAEPADTGTVLSDVGFGGTNGLQLSGITHGLYGEALPVTPGASYQFSAWVDVAEDAVGSNLTITFLDGAFEPLGDDASDARLDLSPGDQGRFGITAIAPVRAAFAVPHLRTEAGGVATIDDILFADRACTP